MNSLPLANVVVGSEIYGAEIHGYFRSVSEDIPEAFCHAMDRRLWPGRDMAHAYVRPVNSPYYEYSAVCRSVSITDLPTMLTVNTTIGEYHTLGEFGVLPRTPLHHMGPVLHLMEDGGLVHFDVRFNALYGGGLIYVKFNFTGLEGKSETVRFSPWHALAAPYYLATVSATPLWKEMVLVEASFRDKHVWNDLWLSGAMSWNIYQDIGLYNTGISATDVSGVMAWKEDIWSTAHLNREWFVAEADAIRINTVMVTCEASGNGPIYVDIFNCPRWIREALTYARPNQWATTKVQARPRHFSDIGVEVVMEVRG